MQDPKNRQKCAIWETITQLCSVISSQVKHIWTIGKKLVKQQYLLHTFSQYGELRPLAAEIGHSSGGAGAGSGGRILHFSSAVQSLLCKLDTTSYE